jgi:micrococcal nuclease
VEPALASLGALALAAALGLALSPELRAHFGAALTDGGGAPAGAERVRVLRVIDGDTLVAEDGRSVRLLGIDTPETHNPSMRGPQPLGEAATARLTEMVEGKVVALEPDVADADHYGRALRHVWVGRTLVAEALAREGLGHALVIPPNTRHAERIRAAEAAAKTAGRGLWGLPRPTALPIFATPGP